MSVTMIDETIPKLGAWTLALSLLCGCSLSAPKEGELFSPSSTDDGGLGARDAAADSTVDAKNDAGADLDTGIVADADSASPADATDVADAGSDSGPAVFDPTSGLVVHYKFNETTGNTVNDFAGDKDALIVGTPSGFEQWISAGRIDGALKLAGGAAPDGGTGHYVELPQGTLLGLEEATIALWLNRAGGPMWQRVFDLGSGPPTWIYLTAVGGTGLPVVAGRTPALIFVDFIPIVDAPAGEGQLRIQQTISVGTWTHFVLTWSATELKVYMNGKFVAMTTTHGAVAPQDLGNTTQNYLGRSQFAADPYFDGMLDDFRIYDHALPASDVTKLFEAN